MKLKILLLLLIVNQAFSQKIEESELKTSINDVTVFLKGAQITRTGRENITLGKSVLIIKSLSANIDEKTIQVKGKGDFTILSVKQSLNYLNERHKDVKIDSLHDSMEFIDLEISTKKSRLEVLKEKQNLMNANRNLGGENSSVSLAQLKLAMDFYDDQLSSIKSEELKTALLIKKLKEAKSKIQRQVSQVSNQKDIPTGEIEITIEAQTRTIGGFEISYLVSNAGWFPKYDVRVKDIDSPIALAYKADVYQNTGVDWNNVKLKLSNGNPNQSSVAPELSTWYLNYVRNTIYNTTSLGLKQNLEGTASGIITNEIGEPLPGVNVIVSGTTIGTVTDMSGYYSLTLPRSGTHFEVSYIGYESQVLPITSSNINVRLKDDISQLSEMVITGYGANKDSYYEREKKKEAQFITTTILENQTTVEFEIEKPYSIKSNSNKFSVDLKQYSIETIYEYYAVPKLDKDAFLIARIIDWDQYNLLEGEANLYFEDTYVGRTILNAKTLTDTLDISLGRDKNIVIGRSKIDDYSKRRTIGSHKIESRGFEIIAKNKKSQSITLTLFDQIPVSVISDITIASKELSKGKLDETIGKVKWTLNLPANQTEKLILRYEVKSPKREKVLLE